MFIDYGHAFTPDREHQQGIVVELIAAVASLVVELCSGGGDLAKLLLQRLPEIRLRAFDRSPRMLAAARQTCAPTLTAWSPGLRSRRARLARAPAAPDVICSSLAVHHLDGGQKRQLFEDLFAALRPGGLFVLADLVRPVSEAGWQIAAADWDRAVAAPRASTATIGGAQVRALRWNYFRWPDDNGIDHPSTVAEHVLWLSAAGFEAVDLHWLLAGHAILSARKP